MELAGYFAVVRRWWTTLLIATSVAGLAGYFIASGVPPTYEGSTSLLVGPVVGDFDVMRAAGAISFTYAELATNEPALDAVRETMGLPADTPIVARAIPNETTRILNIRAEYGDPETAAALANALAENLIAQETSGVVLPEGELTVVAPAVPDPIPIAPQVTLIAIIAAGTGLLAAIVLVVLVEYLGNTVNSRSDLGQLTSVPLLGFAALGQRFRPSPALPSIVEAHPESRSAAAVRFISTKVAYARPGHLTRSVLMVGSAPRDGTADLALGVATALARAGRRVVVVDANDDQGELSTLTGVDGAPGLTELLHAPRLSVGALAIATPGRPSVISRGQTQQVDLIDPDAARTVITRLSRAFEVVVLAGAPIHLSSKAMVWARVVESVVLAVERDRAKRDDVAYALENLAAVQASVLGTVLLDRAPRWRVRRKPRDRRAMQNAAAEQSRRNLRQGAVPTTAPRPVAEPARRTPGSDELHR